MSRNTRAGAAIAALMLGAVTLSACTNPSTPATGVEWEKCGDAECATVEVPLDAANPEGEQIDLAVLRLPASGVSKGVLFFNPGGPGASATALVAAAPTDLFTSMLLDDYDIIAMDPRGVGMSAPVECLDEQDKDDYLYPVDVSAQAQADRARSFAEACEAASGDLLPYLSTEAVAHDMDAVRAALGEDKLHYLGVSYGTLLGATYADLYPENVGNMVLDAATHPDLNYAETAAQQVIGFEGALRAYLDWEQNGDSPVFEGSTDDAMARVADLLEQYENEPVQASDGRMFTGGVLRAAIAGALYSQRYWNRLTSVLHDVKIGIVDSAFTLADDFNMRVNGTYYEEILDFESLTAFNCVDLPAATADEVAALNQRIADEAPVLGAAIDPATSPCAYWPVEPQERRTLTASGAGPILVIGTTNDPATPYEWSAAMAATLESGVHLTRVGEGHGAYRQGSLCIDSAVDYMLLKGTVPEDGAVCED